MSGFPASDFTAIPVISGFSDYYDGSVTMGVSPFRPSCHSSKSVRFEHPVGSSFVPLFPFTTGSFTAKSYSPKINNSEHTVTPVSVAFRWAMLCTKSELRFRQFSFNHRTRNLRSVRTLRLVPYPLYQHAIVPFEFPRQVGWSFPLFTFNNVPLRGRYTFARSSAQS